MKQARAC